MSGMNDKPVSESDCRQYLDELTAPAVPGRARSAALVAHLAVCPECTRLEGRVARVRPLGSAYADSARLPGLAGRITGAVHGAAPAAATATVGPVPVGSLLTKLVVPALVLGLGIGGYIVFQSAGERSLPPAASGPVAGHGRIATASVTGVAATTGSRSVDIRPGPHIGAGAASVPSDVRSVDGGRR